MLKDLATARFDKKEYIFKLHTWTDDLHDRLNKDAEKVTNNLPHQGHNDLS